jgi:hypothetical protein
MKLLNTKKLPILVVSLMLPLCVAVLPAFAQEDEESAQTLQNIEDQRTAELEEQLELTIPEITDNPNHIITFSDPSEEEVGVQLEIDGGGYKKVKSPYTLPSLGIGEHNLKFRFTDREETRQTLEKSIVVIPRPPIINAPQTVSSTQIALNGTALVGSTVDIFLAGGTTNQKGTATVLEDGSWTHAFEGEFPYQIYDIVAITKKGGFASSFSEAVVFELSEDNSSNTPSVTVQPIHFAFKDINADNFRSNLLNNLDLLYLLLGVFGLGILLTILFVLARRGRRERKIEGNFLQFFKGKAGQEQKGDKSADSKKMTLREKFEKAGLQKNGSEQAEQEPVQTLSKDEFMKEYKGEDPDDKKGSEKPKKKKGEKVDVSLTSKK